MGTRKLNAGNYNPEMNKYPIRVKNTPPLLTTISMQFLYNLMLAFYRYNLI